MSKKRLLVLISGSGSNLQSFINAIENNDLSAEIIAVISNKSDAYGLVRAQQANIPAICVEHSQFPDRVSFDNALIETIDEYQPDLIILAGFMRILTSDFVKRYPGKLLNIHPSLLPKYPGLDTHKKALVNKDKFHGSSVHFVTEELDGGPVIAQMKMSLQYDNEQKLNEKELINQIQTQVQKMEHQLYPKVVKWFLDDKLTMKDNEAYFDNKKLQEPFIFINQ